MNLNQIRSRLGFDRTRVARGLGASRWVRVPLLCVALGVALGEIAVSRSGGAEPEIVRARVPAGDISKWFAPGTELRILSTREFDARVNQATQARSTEPGALAPRLIRARHLARWDSGTLSGSTELVINSPRGGQFALEPWTPAVLPTKVSGAVLGVRDSGKAILELDRSASVTVGFEWELKARPFSADRRFALELPVDQTSTLTLEIPKGWTPTCQQEIRGPISTSATSLSTWEIDAGSGHIDLFLSDPEQSSGPIDGAHAWLTSSTEIDMRSAGPSEQTIANWKTDCRVELDARHPRKLEMELEPGLELIDIEGKSLKGYQTTRVGAKTHLVANLASDGSGAINLRILAHAPIPAEGLWTVPAAHPLDATWTGGTTTVLLDEFHWVRECREKAGRRVAPPRLDARAAPRLVFVSQTPDSVADLVLIRPPTRASCRVRGQLYASASPPRVECRLSYNLDRGTIPGVEIELSPGWAPDSVSLQGLSEPIAWHASTSTLGSNRLNVTIPTASAAVTPLTLVIEATRTVADGRSLELPRIRPLDAGITDEAWLAWADPETSLVPLTAIGLAWIDPDELPGPSSPVPTPELKRNPAMAWRWIADQARAVVSRQPIEKEPRATIRTVATVDRSGRTLELDGTIEFTAGIEPFDSIPFAIDPAPSDAPAWTFDDPTTGATLASSPIQDAARAGLGLPNGSLLRSLAVHVSALTRKTIHYHARCSRDPRAAIPLLILPHKFNPTAKVSIVTPEAMRSEVSFTGLRRMAVDDPGPERQGGSSGDSRLPPVSSVVSHVLAYDVDPNLRLELFTEPLAHLALPGFIAEARLTTTLGEGAGALNQLTLIVRPDDARSLEMSIPPHCTLVRVRENGTEVRPVLSGPGFTIALTAHGIRRRASRIVIDYESGLPDVTLPDVARPVVPLVSMPCLEFSWELVVSPGLKASSAGPGLIDQNMQPDSHWPATALGLPRLESMASRTADVTVNGAQIRRLDDQLANMPAEGSNFGEWFSRWDHGDTPLIIDRFALDSAGFTSKTLCVPARVASDRYSISLTTLSQYHLQLVPVGSGLVVTTDAEATRFRASSSWQQVIVEAIAWGADRSDRWQSFARWRTLAASSVAIDETFDRPRTFLGWTIWRFSRSGWPDTDCYVTIADPRQPVRVAWLSALISMVFWAVVRARTTRNRFKLPWTVLVGSVFIAWLLPNSLGSIAAGLFLSALIVLTFELSRGPSRNLVAPATARVGSMLIKPVAGITVTFALLVPRIFDGGALTAAERVDPKSAILALFPYEGSFDPTRPPGQVHMRLSDYSRLIKLGEPVQAPRNSSVVATRAVHRVERFDAQRIQIDSEFDLVARGDGPFDWRVPVAQSRDIHAALDGVALPIRVELGGTLATVVLPGPGRHRLEIKRSTTTRLESGREVATLSVNPAPFARVIVLTARDGRARGDVMTRGRTEALPDKSTSGNLGPMDRIEMRWQPAKDAEGVTSSLTVDELVLWDLHAAGDRVRARFTFQSPEKIEEVRIAREPGLTIRSATCPDGAVISCRDNPGKPEWILNIDPPLNSGATISLDCWRPLAARLTVDLKPIAFDPGEQSARSVPMLQPLAVERITGTLAARRPGNWVGRLLPVLGTEPISDEAFVNAWGNLPSDPLTLSGAVRFIRECRASLITGQPTSIIQAKPSVAIRIESGRLVLDADAELLQTSGNSRQVFAKLPDGIRITRVDGDSIADWSIVADKRLEITLDQSRSEDRRHIHIQGWIPLADDPLKPRISPRRVITPWIDWGSAQINGGSITISSWTKPALMEATGATIFDSETLNDASPGSPRFRQSFKINDARKLGELAWDSTPPRVNVTVESQIKIEPDFVEWIAALRYDVIRGALDTLNVKIPAKWAANASLRVSGGEFQLTTEIREGAAFWSITPKRPIWTAERLLVRSTIPLPADSVLIHPEIAPLGYGAVDSYLRTLNASGRSLTIDASPGLQSITDPSRFREPEFALDQASLVNSFHVRREGSILRQEWPRVAKAASDSRGDSARTAFADIVSVGRPDGSTITRAFYDVVADSGRLWSFDLPEDNSLLSVSRDGELVTPLRSPTGRLSVPIQDRHPSTVGLIWKNREPAKPGSDPRGMISLPRPGTGSTPTLVTIYNDGPSEISTQGGVLEPISITRLHLARAERIAQKLTNLIATFDRSSGKDHERLVSLIVAHEIALRSAQRSFQTVRSIELGPSAASIELNATRIRDAQSAVAVRVKAAGLGDDFNSAREYLGAAADGSNRRLLGIAELDSSDPLFRVGRPVAFVGNMNGIDEAVSEQKTFIPARSSPVSIEELTVPALITLLLLALIALARTQSAWAWPLKGVAFMATLALAAYAGGVLLLISSLGISLVGRGLRARAT